MKKDIKIPQEWPGIHHIDQQEIDAVTRVLKDQSPFRFYGPKPHFETAAFEKEFAAFIGMEHCVMVSNGTTALQVALSALGVGPGDEVIMPSYVCTALLNAVYYVGASPVFAEIDPATFNIDPVDVKKRLSRRTRAIIVPHLFGLAADLDSLSALGLPIIEDCAQSVGGNIYGKSPGTFCEAGIFSFYATKVMTCGEGGMVVSNSKEFADDAP